MGRPGLPAAALLAAAGLFFVMAGRQKASDTAAAEAAAAAFVAAVAPEPGVGPEVRSSVVRDATALVRMTLRDGPHHLRADVRLERRGDRWIGRTIELPDLEPHGDPRPPGGASDVR